MRTRKPISTISYNSEKYLTLRLNEALDKRQILFWCYIRHFPDADDKKEHFHVYAEPVSILDTMSFNDSFIEFDLNNNKPLKCLAWRFSRFDDWFLYCLHDREYLLSHGLRRNTFYSEHDFFFSDYDEFNFRASMIDYSQMVGLHEVIDSALNGISVVEAIKNGSLPYSKITKLLPLYKEILYNSRK